MTRYKSSLKKQKQKNTQTFAITKKYKNIPRHEK